MGVVFSDFGRAKLASGITAGTTAPFTMNLDDGTKFKAYGAGEYEYLVLKDASLNREIIKVTARTGNAFTVSQRAIGPTTARDWSIGDLCEAALTAEALADFLKDTPLTGDTTAENISFALAGRIKGDFSNSTLLNRILLQSNTSNGDSVVGVVPNGSATESGWNAFNTADPTNSSYVSIYATNTGTQLISGKTGTGTVLPLSVLIGAVETLRYGIAGQWGIGGANYGTAAVGAKQSITSGGASAAPSWRTNAQWELVWDDDTAPTHDAGYARVDQLSCGDVTGQYAALFSGSGDSTIDNRCVVTLSRVVTGVWLVGQKVRHGEIDGPPPVDLFAPFLGWTADGSIIYVKDDIFGDLALKKLYRLT